MPRQPMARALSFVWMFVGIVFVALYTAELTANLTVDRIQGAINGPKDLPGKRVGTLQGTISADWLRAHHAELVQFPQIEAMYPALLSKKVDALLLGSPPLRYYAANEGKGLVRLVGPEFEKRAAAFALPENSALRRRINGALVAIEEDGTRQRLYDKWFGTE
jgi:polar amino acid transport system substrate-binding protein